jgi:hypothetical protein
MVSATTVTVHQVSRLKVKVTELFDVCKIIDDIDTEKLWWQWRRWESVTKPRIYRPRYDILVVTGQPDSAYAGKTKFQGKLHSHEYSYL